MSKVSKTRSEPTSSPSRGQSRLGWKLYLVVGIIAALLFLAVNIPVLNFIYLGTGSTAGIIYWAVLIGLPVLLVNIFIFRWLRDSIQTYRWTMEAQRNAGRKSENAR